MVTRVAIGLGSNLGDRVANLFFGIERLARDIRWQQVSSLYETDPVGPVREQPLFLNQVAIGETETPPQTLLELCLRTENERGRVRTVWQGARTLDLDILLYGEMVLNTPDLVVPHPRMEQRGFVLIPLAEIAPDWILPDIGETVAELALKQLPELRKGVRLWQSSDMKPLM